MNLKFPTPDYQLTSIVTVAFFVAACSDQKEVEARPSPEAEETAVGGEPPDSAENPDGLKGRVGIGVGRIFSGKGVGSEWR